MRWRTLLLIGVAVFVVALGIGLATWAVVAPDEDMLTGDLVIAGITTIGFVTILGFVAGWFGRERDDVVLIAIGSGLAATLFFGVGSFVVDDWRIGVALVGVALGIVSALCARVTWWVGDAICELRGLPNGARLTEAAFPEEFPGLPLWTTEAGPALRRTLDALAERVAPGAPVDARAIGILVGVPRERPVAAVLAADRFAVQTVDLEGTPIDEPVVVEDVQLAEVSIRSEAADGSRRDHVNAYDDLVELRTVDGRRLRLRLPYGTRGAGTTTGGPEVIRAWLRTTASTYR